MAEPRTEVSGEQVGSRSLSPTEQARFAQEKLRQIYLETCLWLLPHKDFLNMFQEILLWRKIAISAAIFFLVEIFFWHLYTSNSTYVTMVSDILFWLLLADAFWIVATRDRRIGERTRNQRLDILRRQRNQTCFMSLEEAIRTDAKPLEVGESAPFEVMCLWAAKVIMWIDNIQLALRHWSQEQPYLFAVVTGTFGLVCIIIGYFLSGVTSLFLLTNYLMFLPVFKYYSLLDKASIFVDTHYPVLVTKAVNGYNYIKTFLKPLGEQEFVAMQLDPNKPMKDGLPDQTNGQPNNRRDRVIDQPHSNTRTNQPPPDATLTLTEFTDIDPMESLATFIPPAEGFPSITALFNEDSISVQTLSQASGHTRPPKLHHRGNRPGPTHKKQSQNQDSISLEPFDIHTSIHDSFDEEFISSRPDPPHVVPSAPPPDPAHYEPPPPYSEWNPSPLVNSTIAPTNSNQSKLRHRQDKK